MAFMNTLAYGGPSTWAHLCGSQQPQADKQGLLAPPWGDAIRAAVIFEQHYPGWERDPQFVGGPAGQVIAFLKDRGFGALEAYANATEEAAKRGFVQMQGGGAPMGAPMAVPAQQGGFAPLGPPMGAPMAVPAQQGGFAPMAPPMGAPMAVPVQQGGFAPMGHVAGAQQHGYAPMGAPAHVPTQQMMQGALLPHLQCLTMQTRVEVKEKANWVEALSAIIGQEIEMANKYQVMSDNGEQIFYAVEETDFCTRQLKQCCPDCAPWTLNILYTQHGYQHLVYKLTRPWTCTCLCFNRPSVDIVDVTTNQKIGSISNPCACCNLAFHVRDQNDQEVLLANGGCCQWGMCCPLPCGPCASIDFPISDVSTGVSVGHLQKNVPSCFKFLIAPDVDNYKLDFGKVSNPQWKALLLGLAIFVDFRYFSENSNDDQGGVLGALAD